MTGKDNRIEKILAATSLRIHPHRFVLVSMPLSTLTLLKQRLSDIDSPFWSLSVEEAEVTVILPITAWNTITSYFSKTRVEEDYRVITLDVTVPWDVAGFLTKILGVLAQENISCGLVSGFSRDHLIIKNKDLLRAIEILNQLIESAQ